MASFQITLCLLYGIASFVPDVALNNLQESSIGSSLISCALAFQRRLAYTGADRCLFSYQWSECELTTDIEFKEIRKEWKARKKEEDTARKQAEERDRASAAQQQVDGHGPDPSQQVQGQQYPQGGRPQLPPIGYSPAEGQVPGQYANQQGMMYPQGNGQMQYPPANYPHSPYTQGSQNVYQQR